MGTSAYYSRFYIATPDNQANAKFETFQIFTTIPLITDGRWLEEFGEKERDIRVSPDFNHFIIFLYDIPSSKAYIEYYDKDFKKIWSKEYNNVESIPYDCTVNDFYIVADNHLIVLDTKTGKERIKPAYIGDKIDILLVDDGAILVSRGTKDNIMKTNFKGEILWTANASMDINGCNSMQIIDSNIVLQLDSTSGEGNYKSGLLVIDGDGEIILETY